MTASSESPTSEEWEGSFTQIEPPGLMPWVEAIWYSSGKLAALRERVLPAATCDIVVNLGAPMKLLEGKGPESITGSTTGGLRTRPILLEHPTVHEALGMRIAPLGLHAILGVPAAAITNYTAGLQDVLQTSHDELARLCSEAERPHGVLAVAARWAGKRIQRFSDRIDPLIRWAATRIDGDNGGTSISWLCEKSGYGATRFNQRFKDELGVTPKKYARLVRFREALDSLDPNRPLAELALDLGYSDQAHMNRDFRTLGHTTPTEVLANRYPSGITLAQ